MLFKQTGDSTLPTVIFLHGGGLSDWSWDKIAALMVGRYNVVTTVIDGHGQDGKEEFSTIESCAQKVIEYIKTNHGGKVYAICGLSIGAQIACEVLSCNENIADYAVIESALLYPIKGATALTVPTYRLCYGLIKTRWFAKLQAKTLCVLPELFERYYQDSLNITRQSLINLTISNGNYPLKFSIANTGAQVLIIVGEKELGVMKRSAELLHQTIKASKLYIAPKCKHGEISLAHPKEYVELLESFFKKLLTLT
ncbi:MAG: alpha/beta hydrolase [Oscillospiraceae bacterium]